MKAPKGVWKQSDARFESGEYYTIGTVRVGYVYYRSDSSKDDTRKYRATINLPSIRFGHGKDLFVTQEDAKKAVERVVGTWFGWLGNLE